MRTVQSLSSRVGSRRVSCRCLLGVGWYKEVTDQVWSPALTERRTEYGLKIGVTRVAFSQTVNVWTDGKSPVMSPCYD